MTSFSFVMGIVHGLKSFVRVLSNSSSQGIIVYLDNLLICFTFEVMLYFHNNHGRFGIVTGTKMRTMVSFMSFVVHLM